MPKGRFLIPTSDNKINPALIISTIAEYYNVSLEQLRCKIRNRPVVVPRQMAMTMLRTHTTLTLHEIANMFGGRDHTTTIHSINTIKDLADTNQIYRDDIEAINKKILLLN